MGAGHNEEPPLNSGVRAIRAVGNAVSNAVAAARGSLRRLAEDVVESRRDIAGVAALTLLGAFLRISTISTRSLWLDETISIKQASQSLPDVVKTLAQGVHPPLFHILMHFWVQAFGIGEIAVRMYPTLWGIFSVPVAYWAGRAVLDRRTGLVAAGIAAMSPYLIWYSQEARMYSMMLFFGLASVGFLARAVKTNSVGHWIGYALATFGGMFTHYFFMFLVAGEVAYYVAVILFMRELRLRQTGQPHVTWRHPLAVFKDIPTLLGWLATMSVLATAFGIWLSRSLLMPSPEGPDALVASATGSGLGYGQAAPHFALRFNDVGLVASEILTGFHGERAMYSLVGMWPLVISILLLSLDFIRPLSRRASVLLWGASGILVIFALGQYQGQVLASRYFIGVAAPLLLLIAAAISQMPRRSMIVVLVAGALFATVAWTDQSFNHDNIIRFDNREAYGHIAANYKPGDTVIYEPFYLDPLTNYYLPRKIPSFAFPRYGPYGALRSGKVKLGQDLDRVAGLSPRVWLLLSFQDIPSLAGDAYNTKKWFERHGFRVAQRANFNEVQVILYVNDGLEAKLSPTGGR